ncbi:MAG: hypothetical protein J7513_15140 [Solirubrobacteraceae bacterium]|nr:hypothetical protein [Solirubrobacteraceae bacterium]
MSRFRSLALGAVAASFALPAAGASAATGSAGGMLCKFPLAGTIQVAFQTEIANADVPIGVGVAQPAFVLSTWTTPDDNEWPDFAVLADAGIATLSGAGSFDMNVGRYNFTEEVLDTKPVALKVRERAVTDFRATGALPPFVLNDPDWYGLTTQVIHFNLVAKNSAGTVLTLPPLTTDQAGNPVTDSDGDPTTFDAYCSSTPSEPRLYFGVLQITGEPEPTVAAVPTPDPQPAPGSTDDNDPPYGVAWDTFSPGQIGPDFIDVSHTSGVDEPGGSGIKGYVIFANGQRTEEGFPSWNSRLEGLAPDTDYDVTVYAVDNAGNWSLPISRRFHTLKAGASPVAAPTPKPVVATTPSPSPIRTPGPGETPWPGGPTPTPTPQPEFCINETHPTFRYVAKNNSTAAGILYSSLRFRPKQNPNVVIQVTTSATLGKTTWTPSEPIPLATLIASSYLKKGGSVQLVLSTSAATANSGGLQLDSLLVDPYRRG